jgi:uncharacterized OB-fold protein
MGDKVKLNTKPSEIARQGDAWILHFPRLGKEGQHYHSYGLLTPYFEGLTKGRLMATKCTHSGCPVGRGDGELWLPPRTDCPDCHQPMVWEEVKDLEGYIYAYTYVERGGTGLEIECPYYQVDVRLPGVCTIAKSYLIDRKPIKIGDKVRVKFRAGEEATNTSLDMYFELV